MPANFVKPTYNLLAVVWFAPNKPSLGPFDYGPFPVQIYRWAKNPVVGLTYSSIRFDPVVGHTWKVDDIYEVPGGTGKYFKCQGVQIMHQGFPNEYWQVGVYQCDAAGTIIPNTLP